MKGDTFRLERTKEALHDGIVVAVACSAHADGEVVLSEQILVGVSGILAATIGVMQ